RKVHREDRHQREESQAEGRWTDQQADDQGKTAEELSTTRQRRHQVARCQADTLHVLRGAGQTVTTERPKKLLRAVGCEDDADEDPQNSQAVASAGKQY